MKGFLLDTNAAVAIMRDANSLVARHLTFHAISEVYISSVVLFELYYGAFKSDAARKADNIRAVDELLFHILDFDANDARYAEEIRASLTSRGNMIGPFDILIAGQALSRDLILVTHNIREFQRIEGLRVEDWNT
jgi:tRNA(fMet)-specific endonuclease VapC